MFKSAIKTLHNSYFYFPPPVVCASQTDVMHQSVYELVHTEDQQELRRNLHWALNPPAAVAAVTQDSPQGDHSCRPERKCGD